MENIPNSLFLGALILILIGLFFVVVAILEDFVRGPK